MGIYDKIRQDAKLDSRRFGKAIVCRIVYGSLLSFIKQKGLTPRAIFLDDKYGLDPINNKMIVIPVVKYDAIISLLNDATSRITEDNKLDDIELYEAITRREELLISALQQNMVLVTLDITSCPEQQKAGADPLAYDVLIDSLDVNQNIKAEYVFRNVKNIRNLKNWTDQ